MNDSELLSVSGATEAGALADIIKDNFKPEVKTIAQVNGRDELPIPQKAALDREYLERMSLAFDLRILLTTARAALTGRGVIH